MLLLTKATLSIMLGFITSVTLALLIIPKLKTRAIQTLSIYLKKDHQSKKGTPTMGGIIFILSTIMIIIFLIICQKININYTSIIIIFVFLSYSLIGLIDDYLIIKRKSNKGLTISQKFTFQILIAVIFFFLFLIGDNEPLLWIHTLNIKINIGFFYGILILFILVASSNAVNITDGLDGLVTGLSIIVFLTFGIISYNTDWLMGYDDIGTIAFIIVGSLIGFLLFNTYPAKIFMGDTGSLALGATMGAYAIMTRHEILLILIGSVFFIETLSCLIQIFSYKLFKKRIFPITPIHHTFQKQGYYEKEIVKSFWIIGLLSSMVAIIYGVCL